MPGTGLRHQHTGRPAGCEVDDQRAPRSGSRPPLECAVLDRGEAFVDAGRLVLPAPAELRARVERGRIPLAELHERVGAGQVAVAIEQPVHRVDLRVLVRGLEHDAAYGGAVAARGRDHGRAHGPCRVRVVEDDVAFATGERAVEHHRELGELAALLVAIQPVVAARDQLGGERRLAGAGRPDDQDHVAGGLGRVNRVDSVPR
jgi:hypothetical protein